MRGSVAQRVGPRHTGNGKLKAKPLLEGAGYGGHYEGWWPYRNRAMQVTKPTQPYFQKGNYQFPLYHKERRAMLNLLMKFLPPQAKAGIQLATLLTQALDTPEERQAALDHTIAMIADGKISIKEWRELGQLLFWNHKK